MDAITVVTLSRGRPQLLRRAIESVRAQDYGGKIVHLVIVDHCAETVAWLESCAPVADGRSLLWREERDEPVQPPAGIATVYPRIARLLNLGVALASSRWIAFLDDDNEYEANHLRTLVECAVRFRCRAVHSWRRIYRRDGTPYLDPMFPWARKRADGPRLHELMCERGVWVRHSNVVRDRAGPPGLTPFRNSTTMSAHDPVCMVDTSVWLLARELLLECPWRETFTAQDIANNDAPDDKLLERLFASGVRIVATGLPTLRYYLGGISN